MKLRWRNFIKSASMICFMTVPFSYDLHQRSLNGHDSRTVVCFHGYGGNHTIVEKLREFTDATLVGFNFPDYDLQTRPYISTSLSFGTIQELLPAAHVLKNCVMDQKLDSIDLHGRSAGAGALINLLAILNQTTYDRELKQIGIGMKEKEKILKAIQNGIIILETPLKSVEEIIDLRGSTPELEFLAEQYRRNYFRPIDTIQNLDGLSLDLILYFEDPDEITFNRDDALFIERIKRANRKGTTTILKGSDGGHQAFHRAPWEAYDNRKKLPR